MRQAQSDLGSFQGRESGLATAGVGHMNSAFFGAAADVGAGQHTRLGLLGMAKARVKVRVTVRVSSKSAPGPTPADSIAW